MKRSIKAILAFSLALVGTLAAGLLTGALGGFLSNVVNAPILFPLGMGWVGAFFLEKTLRTARIRKTAQGVVLGCLLAVTIYGTYQAMNYWVFRGRMLFEMNQKMIAETGKSDPLVANVFVDYALKEETGSTGFPGYLLYMDKRGVSIGESSGSGGLNLGPFLTWIFWLLELGIIGWLALRRGRQVAGRAFCETCQRWYGSEGHLGGVSEARAATLKGLLEGKNFARAGGMLEADAELPSLEVYEQGCQTCESSDTHLTLKKAALDPRGKLTLRPLSRMSIRPHERAELLRELRFESGEATLAGARVSAA